MARRPSSVSVKVSQQSLKTFSSRLNGLVTRSANMEPVMAEAARYMVRSTQNRIIRQKTTPSGKRWPALKESTLQIRAREGNGSDAILFSSGNLARSIYVKRANAKGFEISTRARYAAAHQNGVRRTGGRIKNKRIPARRFMGLSLENARQISRMVTEYLSRK